MCIYVNTTYYTHMKAEGRSKAHFTYCHLFSPCVMIFIQCFGIPWQRVKSVHIHLGFGSKTVTRRH